MTNPDSCHLEVPYRRFPIIQILQIAIIVPLLCVLGLVVVTEGPFSRGSYDNRPTGRTTVVDVAQNASDVTVELADGRTVLLAAIDPDRRDPLRTHISKEVTVVGDANDPSSVELVVWSRIRHSCGLVFATWNPWAAPLPRYKGEALATRITFHEESTLDILPLLRAQLASDALLSRSQEETAVSASPSPAANSPLKKSFGRGNWPLHAQIDRVNTR